MLKGKSFEIPQSLLRLHHTPPDLFTFSGSVNKQGPFVLPPEAAAVSITELINMSGGLSPVANKSKISVTRSFRDNKGKLIKTEVFVINLDALTAGEYPS